MTQMNALSKIAAYNEGYRDGVAHKSFDHKSEYVWFTTERDGEYLFNYANGYRDGWNGKE